MRRVRTNRGKCGTGFQPVWSLSAEDAKYDSQGRSPGNWLGKATGASETISKAYIAAQSRRGTQEDPGQEHR
jgi:hypothetical protein